MIPHKVSRKVFLKKKKRKRREHFISDTSLWLRLMKKWNSFIVFVVKIWEWVFFFSIQNIQVFLIMELTVILEEKYLILFRTFYSSFKKQDLDILITRE